MASGDISTSWDRPFLQKRKTPFSLLLSQSLTMTQVGLELEINLLQPPLQPPRPLMGSSILRLWLTVEQAVRGYTRVTQPEHYTY